MIWEDMAEIPIGELIAIGEEREDINTVLRDGYIEYNSSDPLPGRMQYLLEEGVFISRDIPSTGGYMVISNPEMEKTISSFNQYTGYSRLKSRVGDIPFSLYTRYLSRRYLERRGDQIERKKDAEKRWKIPWEQAIDHALDLEGAEQLMNDDESRILLSQDDGYYQEDLRHPTKALEISVLHGIWINGEYRYHINYLTESGYCIDKCEPHNISLNKGFQGKGYNEDVSIYGDIFSV